MMHSSLDPLFRPRSIAVIGASREQGSIGWQILHNLLEYGFTGPVFPVNKRAVAIHSVKCSHSILDVESQVDLGVIVVPMEYVLDVAKECGEKGVRGLVVISAGFKEMGPEGRRREEELVRIIRSYDMRMIGPNCMGIINTEDNIRMNATFASTRPLRGNVSLISQSGALGEAILDYARDIHLGVSMFASIGNRADVSSNDLLEYWEDDLQTEAILLYLESFGNPRKFTPIAKRLARQKRLVAVKGGRTQAGARAVSSHTGALAGVDFATDALLQQCGVLRVSTIDEMFNVASCLATQPLPRGNRVAIVTNAGGPGILATDACASLGLTLSELTGKSRELLRANLPPEASVENPIDLIASADPESYRNALQIVLSDKHVDAVVAIFIPPMMVNAEEVAQEIALVSQSAKKPILACFMGRGKKVSAVHILTQHGIPVYSFPESAIKTLANLDTYRQWGEKEEGQAPRFRVQQKKAETTIRNARPTPDGLVSPLDAQTLLECYGIPFPESAIAETADDAMDRAEQIGPPVVLKVLTSTHPHKSEAGLVVTDLRDLNEVRKAFRRLQKQTRELSDASIQIQQMISGGKEVVMGMVSDPIYGPILMFGLGGIYVEALEDVTFKIHPISDVDAREMIEGIKAFPLLQGIRGEAPVHLARLTEYLLRLSQLIQDFDIIRSLDINPLIATSDADRCRAVDARIWLKPTED